MASEALWRLAFAAWRAGDGAKALDWLNQATQRFPREEMYFAAGRVPYWKARIYEKRGAKDDARRFYTQAVRDYPLSVYALLALERLRHSFPQTRASLVHELRTMAPDAKKHAIWDFQPQPLFAEPGFLRAVELAEPELLERRFPDAARVEEILAAAEEFRNPDLAAEVETAWDLWQLQDEWRLTPTPARLSCFGPRFESEAGEHLRLDFGLDAHFLPQPGHPEGLKMVRSNLTSLLRLVHSLDEALPIERRQLWSESGGNFAERLQSALR